MMFNNRALIVFAVAAITASTACTTSSRPTARGASAVPPAKSAAASAVSHPPWRPLHKGGASLSTGVYVREDDDLVVNTPLPIVLRRTYNSGDRFPRTFGLDTTHAAEQWIRGDSDPRIPWGELILATGARIRFVRISPGNTQEGAVLRHDSTPSEFNGALLSWTGSRWEMRFRDGSMTSFLDCQKDKEVCWPCRTSMTIEAGSFG